MSRNRSKRKNEIPSMMMWCKYFL